jgi:hypothetical protein
MWSTLRTGITNTGESGLKLPTQQGIPTLDGKCPGTGYYLYNGKCYPDTTDLPPSKVQA